MIKTFTNLLFNPYFLWFWYTIWSHNFSVNHFAVNFWQEKSCFEINQNFFLERKGGLETDKNDKLHLERCSLDRKTKQTHTHTHTISLFLCFKHINTLSLSLSLSQTHTNANAHAHYFSVSSTHILSYTRTHTYTSSADILHCEQLLRVLIVVFRSSNIVFDTCKSPCTITRFRPNISFTFLKRIENSSAKHVIKISLKYG